jgi:hypothetical protein
MVSNLIKAHERSKDIIHGIQMQVSTTSWWSRIEAKGLDYIFLYVVTSRWLYKEIIFLR